MNTRSKSTIKYNTTVIKDFYIDSVCFEVRVLNFRKNRDLFIITNKNLQSSFQDNKVKIAAELFVTNKNTLRYCRYPLPEYLNIKDLILCEVSKLI